MLNQEEYLKKYTITDMYKHYCELMDLKERCKEKNKKYRKTEKGILATREASKRYYYKKNNKYHEKYNPTQ